MTETISAPPHSPLLRYSAIAEGVTLLLLMLIAMPLKHGFGIGIVVKWVGWVHGLAFIVYVWAVFNELTRWDAPKGWVWKAIAVSFLPGGTLWFFRGSLNTSNNQKN